MTIGDKHEELIFKNKSFCMYPWIHLYASPNGEVYPCCSTDTSGLVGNTKKQTMQEIWDSAPMQEIRAKMLAGEPVIGCSRCYEQEENGFYTMRMSANKNFGHHIELTDNLYPPMKMIYWDIRFSNLCNLRCRSCSHTFSSNWYDDQVKIHGQGFKKNNSRIFFAGKTENDIWNQLEPQIKHLEQVYFAGGEPLIMEEHYQLLRELIKQKRTNVKLIYNTNFTQLTYKKTNILELWREFDSVSVGASLDAMGSRGEYMRKGTNWAQVERNREEMLKTCPEIDFHISPTLSIMNALHIPDFHRNWVDKGFIKPEDLMLNLLQHPNYYRIDALPFQYKVDIQELYLEHIKWLKPQDKLTRATVGFEGAIRYMMATDNTNLLPEFKKTIDQLDEIRNEKLTDAIPELKELYDSL